MNNYKIKIIILNYQCEMTMSKLKTKKINNSYKFTNYLII